VVTRRSCIHGRLSKAAETTCTRQLVPCLDNLHGDGMTGQIRLTERIWIGKSDVVVDHVGKAHATRCGT
jgi:hypothetical protein